MKRYAIGNPGGWPLNGFLYKVVSSSINILINPFRRIYKPFKGAGSFDTGPLCAGDFKGSAIQNEGKTGRLPPLWLLPIMKNRRFDMKNKFSCKAALLIIASLVVLGLLLSPLAGLQVAWAQANANTIIQVNADDNNILIETIEYEVMDPGGSYTWTQTASGQDPPDTEDDGNPLPAEVPVNIVRVVGGGGLEFFPEVEFPTTSNFNSRVASGATAPATWAPGFEIRVFTPTAEIRHRTNDEPNPDYFEEINNVISIPDMRSYWDLGAQALGAATETFPQSFMDVLFNDPIRPGDAVLISERHGNTPMSFTPLDIDGNVIMDGATVSIAGDELIGGELYQWNTRIANDPDSASGTDTSLDQRQWLIMVNAELFYNGDPDLGPVYGYRVNMTTTDGGDGKILLFRSALSVDKTADPQTYSEVGDLITYTFVVTNNGTATLTTVTVEDPLPGLSAIGFVSSTENSPLGTLIPGESATYTATYTVTQEDLDNGQIDNTVTADSDQTSEVKDDETVTADQVPSISLVKSALPQIYSAVGDVITYTFTVENTGNVTLTNVKIDDARLGISDLAVDPSTLAPGESGTATATYTITQDDIDDGEVENTATATGEDPNDDPVTDEDDETVTAEQVPSISLVKSALPSTYSEVGDEITYTFTVTNGGNVTLTDVSVFDNKLFIIGTIASMAPGDSAALSATYTVTQVDIDAGKIENTAVATGKPPVGDPVTDDDDETVTAVQDPAITLTKTALPQTFSEAGEAIVYTFTVTNTGNVTLTNVTLTEDLFTGSGTLPDPVFESSTESSAPGTLLPGESATYTATYTITQDDMDTDQVDNTATATGKPPVGEDVSATDDETVTADQNPAIALTKTADPQTFNEEGDVINYTFTVENTGNVTLYNVTIDDPTVTVVGGPIAELAVGATDSTTFTATYTITQEDVDAGQVDNTATVSAVDPNDDPVSDSDFETITAVQDEAISLTKTATHLNSDEMDPVVYSEVGDVITYTFIVTNTGNVTLVSVEVTDPLFDANFNGTIGTLIPGASITLTGNYIITQEDLDAGSVANTATAAGYTPEDDPEEDPTVTDSDDETVDADQDPSIELDKSADKSDLVLDEVITYTFKVTNTGNVTLTNVTITDPLPGLSAISPPSVDELAPGETTVFTATYTITQEDIDAWEIYNIATVTGTPPEGPDVTDTDDETVFFLCQAPFETSVWLGDGYYKTINMWGDLLVVDSESVAFNEIWLKCDNIRRIGTKKELAADCVECADKVYPDFVRGGTISGGTIYSDTCEESVLVLGDGLHVFDVELSNYLRNVILETVLLEEVEINVGDNPTSDERIVCGYQLEGDVFVWPNHNATLKNAKWSPNTSVVVRDNAKLSLEGTVGNHGFIELANLAHIDIDDHATMAQDIRAGHTLSIIQGPERVRIEAEYEEKERWLFDGWKLDYLISADERIESTIYEFYFGEDDRYIVNLKDLSQANLDKLLTEGIWLTDLIQEIDQSKWTIDGAFGPASMTLRISAEDDKSFNLGVQAWLRNCCSKEQIKLAQDHKEVNLIGKGIFTSFLEPAFYGPQAAQDGGSKRDEGGFEANNTAADSGYINSYLKANGAAGSGSAIINSARGGDTAATLTYNPSAALPATHLNLDSGESDAIIAVPTMTGDDQYRLDSIAVDIKGTLVVVSLDDYAYAFGVAGNQLWDYLRDGKDYPAIKAVISGDKVIELVEYATNYHDSVSDAIANSKAMDSGLVAAFKKFVEFDGDGEAVLEPYIKELVAFEVSNAQGFAQARNKKAEKIVLTNNITLTGMLRLNWPELKEFDLNGRVLTLAQNGGPLAVETDGMKVKNGTISGQVTWWGVDAPGEQWPRDPNNRAWADWNEPGSRVVMISGYGVSFDSVNFDVDVADWYQTQANRTAKDLRITNSALYGVSLFNSNVYLGQTRVYNRLGIEHDDAVLDRVDYLENEGSLGRAGSLGIAYINSDAYLKHNGWLDNFTGMFVGKSLKYYGTYSEAKPTVDSANINTDKYGLAWWAINYHKAVLNVTGEIKLVSGPGVEHSGPALMLVGTDARDYSDDCPIEGRFDGGKILGDALFHGADVWFGKPTWEFINFQARNYEGEVIEDRSCCTKTPQCLVGVDYQVCQKDADRLYISGPQWEANVNIFTPSNKYIGCEGNADCNQR